jgi:hypothetical protein
MEFADQRGSAERMKTRPFLAVLGDRAPIDVEADDIAPASAAFDRLGGLPGETAAEVEVVGIVPPQGLGDGAEISFGEPPRKGRLCVRTASSNGFGAPRPNAIVVVMAIADGGPLAVEPE